MHCVLDSNQESGQTLDQRLTILTLFEAVLYLNDLPKFSSQAKYMTHAVKMYYTTWKLIGLAVETVRWPSHKLCKKVDVLLEPKPLAPKIRFDDANTRYFVLS